MNNRTKGEDSMSEGLKKGDRVYSAAGTEYEYVEAVSLGHIVLLVYEDYDNNGELLEVICSTPLIVRNVYCSIKQKVHPKIKSEEESIELLKGVRQKLEAECFELDARKVALNKHGNVMDNIEVFLSKSDPFQYILVGYQIYELKEGLKGWYGKRLVALFGDSKGDLCWRLNQYGDGSGGWEAVRPFTTLEEAKAALEVQIASATPGELNGAIHAARLHGLEVAESLVEACKKRLIAKHERDLDYHRSRERDLIKYHTESLAAIGEPTINPERRATYVDTRD